MSLFTGISKPGQSLALPVAPPKLPTLIHPFSDTAHTNPRLIALHELKNFVRLLQQKNYKLSPSLKQKLNNKVVEIEALLKKESVHSLKFLTSLQELLHYLTKQKSKII